MIITSSGNVHAHLLLTDAEDSGNPGLGPVLLPVQVPGDPRPVFLSKRPSSQVGHDGEHESFQVAFVAVRELTFDRRKFHAS